jgi:hypothetical protein
MSERVFGRPSFLGRTTGRTIAAKRARRPQPEVAMIALLLRCIAALARAGRFRGPSPWLADCLVDLERQQRCLARAARCVVSGSGPDSLEDLLCNADRMQERLAELCERAAVIAALRAMAAQRERRHDPGLAA